MEISSRFDTYIRSLDYVGLLEEYATRAGTTAKYIRVHLIAPPERRKVPREKSMDKLVASSDGKLTKMDLLEHFYNLSDDVAA